MLFVAISLSFAVFQSHCLVIYVYLQQNEIENKIEK
jgi:hypothetical protein